MPEIPHGSSYVLYHQPSQSWRCWCVVSRGYVGERWPSRDAALADREAHLAACGAPVLPLFPEPAKQLELMPMEVSA